jgi:hypothetical protein
VLTWRIILRLIQYSVVMIISDRDNYRPLLPKYMTPGQPLKNSFFKCFRAVAFSIVLMVRILI